MKELGLIYCYTHIPTNKKYIGQTTNLKKRINEHMNENRTNPYFHNLLHKHPDDFLIEIIEDNIPKNQLDEKERCYIKLYNTMNNGFNLTPGGDGGFIACNNYWKNNPLKMKEHIEKIQPLAVKAAKEWRKNNPILEQQRLDNLHKKSSEWRKTHPEEFKENLKNAQNKAEEWRKKHPEEFKNNQKKASIAKSKRVLLINTGEEFISASEASRRYNIPASNISACCRGVRKSAGKNKNGEKLIWQYI